MADIVNLRSIRKRKMREDDARKADENRIRHGRSKSEKLLEKAQADRIAARLDAHRRERGTLIRPDTCVTAFRDGDE